MEKVVAFQENANETLRLRLRQSDAHVVLVAVDENGLDIKYGSILDFRVDADTGDVVCFRPANVNRSLDLQLDDEGRLIVK